MISTKPRAVIFDWDNTLVDSWNCILAAMNATLRAMGLAEWTMAEARDRVALSMRDSFPQLFGERWEEARDIFYSTFRAIHLDHLKPLPGATRMLAELAEQNIYLAVVSNKNGAFLRKEAQTLGWTGFFGRLVGATDAEQDKPSAAPVRLALADSGIEPGAHVWFCGDAAVDIECAHNSGCTPILIRPDAPRDGEFPGPMPSRHLAGCGEFAALVRELSVPISGF